MGCQGLVVKTSASQEDPGFDSQGGSLILVINGTQYLLGRDLTVMVARSKTSSKMARPNNYIQSFITEKIKKITHTYT